MFYVWERQAKTALVQAVSGSCLASFSFVCSKRVFSTFREIIVF